MAKQEGKPIVKLQEEESGVGRNFELLVRLTVWFLISLALSLIFFREFWASLGTMLSPNWIFGESITLPPGVYLAYVASGCGSRGSKSGVRWN